MGFSLIDAERAVPRIPDQTIPFTTVRKCQFDRAVFIIRDKEDRIVLAIV